MMSLISCFDVSGQQAWAWLLGFCVLKKKKKKTVKKLGGKNVVNERGCVKLKFAQFIAVIFL